MRFKTKIIHTYEYIKLNGKKSLSKLSKLVNQSKSSLHRQIRVIDNRSNIPGADFFETVQGAIWLRRLVLAATLVFGLQGKVGEDRLSLFCNLICIQAFVGVSASSMGRLKNKMMEQIGLYEQELRPTLDKLAADISIVAGADETFFDRLLLLLFMDLSSGYICMEESAENRKATTWGNKTALVRNKFKEILCLTSDRGRSLIKFSKNATIKSIAELFHMQQSIVRVFRYAFASKRESLEKQKKEAIKELDNLIISKASSELIKSQKKIIRDIEERNTVINNGQATYRKELFNISTVTHPFKNNDEAKKSSELSAELNSSLSILRNTAKVCEITDKNKNLNYFEKNIPEMASLVDLWWQWVDCDLEHYNCSHELKEWLRNRLLPAFYWKQQIKKSRASKPLRDYYVELSVKAEEKLHADILTSKPMIEQWSSWAKHWVLKFQRSTSQVEGRNARLSETHHCLRGMSKLQIKTDTILHNVWNKRDDGTTATERLFKFKPPDLFEWLLSNMSELAMPRKSRKQHNYIAMPAALIPAI
jgi:hypothetical protein